MDAHDHVDDFFGSERRPPLVVEESFVVSGTREGSICVHRGATLTIAGTQIGTVALRSGSSLVVRGIQNGTLRVGPDSSVEVHGAVNGSVHVEPRGRVHVLPGAKLAGSLHVDGIVENQGLRGGRVSGSGFVRDLDGGSEKQPRIENGNRIYYW